MAANGNSTSRRPISRAGTGRLRKWSILAVSLTALVGAYVLFVEAPPPSSLTIAAGAKDGQYYRVAERYAEVLRRSRIQVVVLETKGSGENLELLTDAAGSASVALVQGGAADAAQKAKLKSLGSLYREPFWMFLKKDDDSKRLAQLAGRRIAVGAEGSGTRKVALQLFGVSGVDEKKAAFLPLGGQEAAAALEGGSIDAACFVAGVDAAYIQRLGKSPKVRLMSFDEQEALVHRFRHLSPVTVPAGLIDLAGPRPEKDVALVAPAAMLVARPTLHPALAAVLLEAATHVHADGDALSAPGEFPSAKFVDIPLSEEAEHFHRHGPPLLQRLLPFWIAAFVDRIKLLALPLIVVAMPLMRMAPPLLRWRTRRKIYLWYSQLQELDHRMFEGMSQEEAVESLASLRELEANVSRVQIPLSYMEEYYNLRLHLNLVHRRIRAIVEEGETNTVASLRLDGGAQ